MPPTRSNPAYAHLAYQSAIADQIVEDILEKYVGNEVSTTVTEIECVRLVQEDAIVPPEEIMHFVDRLKNYMASTDRELGRFEFVRREDEQGFGIGHQTLNPSVSGPGLTSQPQGSEGSEVLVAAERKRRRRKRGKRGRGCSKLT